MKTKHIFNLLILIVLLQLCSTINLSAQKLKLNKEPIIVNQVPMDKIEAYRNNNSFKYVKKTQLKDSLWDIFWHYLNKFIEKVFSNKGATPYIRNTLIAAILIFIAIYFFKADFSGIFGKNINIAPSNFDYYDENIREIDFDKEISKAIEKENYRLAIRFLYLKLLLLLDKNRLIYWLPEKTNQRYLQELSHEAIYPFFKKLSRIYEYSWYGHFEPEKQQFYRFLDEFKHSFSLINKNN